ncbi:MAG: class I SAM-dependent methyltransferase [Planctomycetota bacterium]
MTAMRDARDDWRHFDAGAIPSKASTPHLDAFLEAVAEEAGGSQLALLDVGCGSGRLSQRVHEQGFSVLGVDINPDAIHTARQLTVPTDATARSLRFEVADFAADASPLLDGGPFDVAVCQLVISIIGTPRQRANLLRHARHNLRPGGRLFLSASGVSDTINPGYGRLYADDFPLTGERHTYFSLDARGDVLYTTHHSTEQELHDLLAAAGFDEIGVTTERETSSRRPDEAAYFLYATCRATC